MAKRSKKVSILLRKAKKNARKSYRSSLDKKMYIEAQANRMKKQKTWPEKRFEELLKEIGVKFTPQKVLKNKIFDYYIPSKRILVEVDGDYFHAHPDKYDKNSRNKMQESIVRNDRYKDRLAQGMGYVLYRVWESELKDDYEGQKKRFARLLK